MLIVCLAHLVSLIAAQDAEVFEINNDGRSFCVCFNVTGWLVDWTSEFNASFYLAGLCCILSAVFVMMVDRLVEKKNRDLVKIANASADSEICPINGRDPLEA